MLHEAWGGRRLILGFTAGWLAEGSASLSMPSAPYISWQGLAEGMCSVTSSRMDRPEHSGGQAPAMTPRLPRWPGPGRTLRRGM